MELGAPTTISFTRERLEAILVSVILTVILLKLGGSCGGISLVNNLPGTREKVFLAGGISSSEIKQDLLPIRMKVNNTQVRAGLRANPTRFNHTVEASILAITSQLRNKPIMMVRAIAPEKMIGVPAQIDLVPAVTGRAKARDLRDGYAQRLR